MNKLELPRFNTIGRAERLDAADVLHHGPLSGFLGGEDKGGEWVDRLERRWERAFGCTHAIAVNSATSGLLAACHAIGVRNEEVMLSPYTMSATAAAPVLMGADLKFVDIDEHYCLDPNKVAAHLDHCRYRAVIATNLFGHPAQLKLLAQLAHANGAFLIEDNAQAPFAKESGSYAGTIGDIGVFSLNVHKHIQAGEGGLVVTDNDDFAHSIRGFINHGEMAGGPAGLNLRMTEVTAAIACAQLSRAPEIVQSRIDLAEALIVGLRDNPLVEIRQPRQYCRHVYYTLPMEVSASVPRSTMVAGLRNLGVPLEIGYVPPLYRLPAFREYHPFDRCHRAEELYDVSLVYFEICGYDPSPAQIKQIIDAFDYVASSKWEDVCSLANAK